MLIDHAWVWRADHGVEGFTAGRQRGHRPLAHQHRPGRRSSSTATDVTATGLFVEHFQQHNTIWNGEDGEVVLYQNELPYDPPTPGRLEPSRTGPSGGPATRSPDAVAAPPALRRRGLRLQPQRPLDRHPARVRGARPAPAVRLHHVLTVNLDAGAIEHVVNDVGDRVDSTSPGRAELRRRPPEHPEDVGAA